MSLFTPEEAIEDDLLNDLMEEINELYEACEQTLIELELTPEDNELQRTLFRNVHTIKGDLGLVGFTPMIALLQHVEDLLDMLRKGEMRYCSGMSDLVLLSMDRVKDFVKVFMQAGKVEVDDKSNQQVIKIIQQIKKAKVSDYDKLLLSAVLVFDPSKADDSDKDTLDTQPVTLAKTGIPKQLPSEKQLDLLFFRELMKAIEKRSGYKEGRGDRIAKLAFYINDLAGKPIEEDQLAVASFVHDFGMSFLPVEVVLKQENTEMELNMLRSHVYKSARLLENLVHWDEARKIVMQHHENMDGSGYPLGLNGEQICEGAKLLAILDRYDGLTHSENHYGHELVSPKDAVIALNKEFKGQLSPKWLRLFNQAMTRILTQ